MKRSAYGIFFTIWMLGTAASVFAEDTITLNNGKIYKGDILFSNDTDYVISVNGEARWLPIVDIDKIDFGPKNPKKGTN